jgi:hypothetical protein
MAAQAAGLSFEDFDQWSADADNYDARDAASAWRSFTPGKGVGAGTLFEMAARHGWRYSSAPTITKAPAPKPRQSKQADVLVVWNRCKSANTHPYIDAKQGTPDGLRIVPSNDPLTVAGYSVAGWLAVPAYAAGGNLQSLQFIPEPGHGKKLNMPGASMKGATFTVGDLATGDVAYLVEGIGQAWACHKASGQPAIVCFGWGNVSGVAETLKSRPLVIVPDSGKEQDADAIAAGVGCKVATMPEGEAVNFDANDYAQREGYPALAALLKQANAPTPNYAAPEPLRRPMPGAAPYPTDALGEVLGGAAKAIHAVVKAPAAMCGTSVLAAASLAAQGQADVINDGRREPLTLWAVTIGASGERKSAVDTWALGAHRQHEKAAQEQYREELEQHSIEQAAYKEAKQAALKKGKGDRHAIKAGLRAVGEPPEAPLQPILTMGEPTLEGAQRQLINGWPTIGLFSDDAGEFLGGYSMSKENKTRTAASFSKLWDNGSFDRVRAKADEVAGKHYGKRAALHLTCQPVIAESVLSDDVLAGQGFLPRCLLAWPTSTIGSRDYVAADLSENPALRRYWAKIHALLNRPYPLADGTRNELQPRALTLTPDAKALWIQTQDAIEHQTADKGNYDSVKAWANKTGSQVLRIAGVLALIDNPDAVVIEAKELERAAELALWHLSEAVRIVGTASIPPEVKHAESLLDWCHDTGRDLLYSSDALQYGPGSIRTKGTFDAAMIMLERAGWAVPLDEGANMPNERGELVHRRRVWQIVEGEA